MSLIKNTGWMIFQSFTYEVNGSGTLYNYAGAQYNDANYCYGIATDLTDNCGRLLCKSPVIPGGFFKGNVVSGIEVGVLRQTKIIAGSLLSVVIEDSFASLIKNNVIEGADYQQDVLYPVDVDTWAYYGGATDKWLLAWKDTDINSTFGFAINPTAYKDSTPRDIRPYINQVVAKVYYEPRGMFMAG